MTQPNMGTREAMVASVIKTTSSTEWSFVYKYGVSPTYLNVLKVFLKNIISTSFFLEWQILLFLTSC